LAGLDGLRNLNIDSVELKDSTARSLIQLKSLWNLSLLKTGISEQVIEELEQGLPNCKVEVR